jgi:hypothetical protein
MFHPWAPGEDWTFNTGISMRHLSSDYKAVFLDRDIYCLRNCLKPGVYWTLYKIRFSTSHAAHYFSITWISRIVLFREIVPLSSQYHPKHINAI